MPTLSDILHFWGVCGKDSCLTVFTENKASLIYPQCSLGFWPFLSQQPDWVAIRIVVGDYRLESCVADKWLLCRCEHELGANNSEFGPKHDHGFGLELPAIFDWSTLICFLGSNGVVLTLEQQFRCLSVSRLQNGHVIWASWSKWIDLTPPADFLSVSSAYRFASFCMRWDWRNISITGKFATHLSPYIPIT